MKDWIYDGQQETRFKTKSYFYTQSFRLQRALITAKYYKQMTLTRITTQQKPSKILFANSRV